MKKVLIIGLGAIAALTCSGCMKKNEEKQTLATPTNLSVQADGENTYIVFKEVDEADYYTISINDMTVTIEDGEEENIKYNASNIITQPKQYTIKVKAEGDNFISSQYSLGYSYYYQVNLNTPIINREGGIINWPRVPNADYYEVKFEGELINAVYTTSINSYNIENYINTPGSYKVKVRSISNNQGYIASDYSNEINIITNTQLPAPTNIVINNINNELLLSFMCETELEGAQIEVNGEEYLLNKEGLYNVSVNTGISNMYTIKLSTLISAYGNSVGTKVDVRVKAISNNEYILSSNYSNSATYEFKSRLASPNANLKLQGDNAVLTINSSINEDLMGYHIYIGSNNYKTITKDIITVLIPTIEINNLPIFIQAISNNQRINNSLLSDPLYCGNYDNLNNPVINYLNQSINYMVQGAQSYCVEIYNNTYYSTIFTNEDSLDLTNLAPDVYTIKVSAISSNKQIGVAEKTINHKIKLNKAQDVTLDSIINIGKLTFNPVDNAYGYVLYINNVRIDKLFDTNVIDITEFVNEANKYYIEVQAIGRIVDMYISSDKSSSVEYDKTITLSKPQLSLVKQDGKTFLNIDVNENEKGLATKCVLWLDFVQQELDFKDAQIDITTQLQATGGHTIIIQALAIDNEYINNSKVNMITQKTFA